MDYRLADKLKDPKKLIELVDAGIEDPEVATCALAEILEQLYQTDKHQTLITIDGYNTWYLPTRYPSYRYANDRRLNSRIHLSRLQGWGDRCSSIKENLSGYFFSCESNSSIYCHF